MAYKYRTADTSTLKGLKRAEWYKSHGWTIISTGLFLIQFQKKVEKKEKTNGKNNRA